MDPQIVVKKAPIEAHLIETGTGLRPRTREDFAEPAMKVYELNIALRKEELLRLLIAGNRTRRCAEILGLAANTVRTYIKCPEFQKMLMDTDEKLWARVDEEIRVSKLSTIMRIEELSEKALERIEDLMSSDDESIVFRASSDILDRNANTAKHRKEEVDKRVVVIDPIQLALAAQTAREIDERNQERVKSLGPGTDSSTELTGH